jgi:hypothetical protein
MSTTIRINRCKLCVTSDDSDEEYYRTNNYVDFNTSYCVTSCDGGIVPKHIHKSQVFKYIKLSIEKHNE